MRPIALVISSFLAGLFVGNTHHAEGVSAVARPVMVGAKPDVAVVLRFLLVIPAKGLAPGFGTDFIEPDGAEHAPGRFNAHASRALALVLDHLNGVASGFKGALE